MKVLILVDYDLDEGEDAGAASQALADAVGEQVGVNDASVVSEPVVLVAGNAFAEGLVIHGPFEDVEAAEDFASDQQIDDWLTTTLKVG